MTLNEKDREEIRTMLKNAILALNDKNFKACKKFSQDTVDLLTMKGII